MTSTVSIRTDMEHDEDGLRENFKCGSSGPFSRFGGGRWHCL